MFNINTLFSINCTVFFNNVSYYTFRLFYKFCSPISYITESLNDEFFPFNSNNRIIDFLKKSITIQKIFDCIEYSKSCTLCTSSNTSMINMLSSTASFKINILFSFNILICILDPCHNLFIGSHVRSQTIYCCSDKTFFNKFHRVSSSNTFKFSY